MSNIQKKVGRPKTVHLDIEDEEERKRIMSREARERFKHGIFKN